MKKIILGAALMLLSISSSQATLLSANGTILNALDLNGVASSFEDFYDYDANGKASANTGYESEGIVSVFFAELNNEIGIFTIAKGTNGLVTNLDMSAIGTEGGYSFVEEKNEQESLTSVSWTIYNRKTDGSIYSGFTTNDWSVDFSFSNLTNIDQYQILTFTGTNASVIELGSLADGFVLSSFEAVNLNLVPEPSLIGLLGLGIIGLRLRRKV